MWCSKGDKYYWLELYNATAWRTLSDHGVCPCHLIADDTGLSFHDKSRRVSRWSWVQKVSVLIYGQCSFQTLCNGHGYLPKGGLVNQWCSRDLKWTYCLQRRSRHKTEQTLDCPAHPAFSFTWYIGHSAKSHSCLVENFAFLIRKNNFSCLFFPFSFSPIILFLSFYPSLLSCCLTS